MNDFNEKMAIKKLFKDISQLYENKGYSFAFESSVEIFIEVLNGIIESKQKEEEKQNGNWESPLSLKNIHISSNSY